MNSKLENIAELSEIIQQFQEMDTQSFILKNPVKLNAENLRFVAEQIAARKKAKSKLPTWFTNQQVIFPTALSLEQASSEITAKYKSELIKGNLLIDLTGGMGIDCSFFINHSKSIIYIEQKVDLVEIAKHNFNQLGIQNVTFLNANALDFIQQFNSKADWIYLDPARRDNSQNKVFRIEDCEPNILKIKEDLFKISDNILIKFSPLLDIKLAIEQLKNVVEVHIVAVENEVKELLFILRNQHTENIKISTINLPKQKFDFTIEEEATQLITYSKPMSYIYEPNAAVMKAGAFKSIGGYFGLNKIAPNSHLYTADFWVDDFVGRGFKCEAVCKFDKKEIAQYVKNNKANISVRNFPMKPDEIRKKLGLKDGGEVYLFFTEDFEKKKLVLVCSKV
jgi:16S rRNA G966 N2-methylase RsmD